MERPADRETLEVIARRIDLLEGLAEEPLHKAEMVERFDDSRSTVNRAINELEERGLVTRLTPGYVTTQAGQLAAARYRAFRQEEGRILAAAPVLGAIPHDAEVPAALLEGATIGGPDDDYALFELIARLFGEAGSVHAVLPRPIDSRYLRTCHAHVVDGELAATVVSPPDALEATAEEFPHLADELADAQSFTARVGDVPPYGLLAFRTEPTAELPEEVILLGGDRDGVDGYVHTDEPAVAAWASEVIAAAVDDTRDAEVLLERPDGAAVVPGAELRGLPAELRTQGFVRIDDRYFDRREPLEPLAAWRAGLGLAEVQAGYAVPRSRGETAAGDGADGEARFAEVLSRRLRAGEDLTLIGPPGAGKSTVCKRVACAWYEAGRGPVFYRESGRSDEFTAVGTLECALERASGTPLVVVEDAPRSEANAVFELVESFRGDDRVRFLFDARETEWNEPESFPPDARLRTVRRDALSVLTMPPLDEGDCRRLVERVAATVGDQPEVPPGDLLAEVRADRDADRAAPGGITLLLHRLTRYADPLDEADEGPTTLDAEVDRLRATLDGDERARSVGTTVALLIATGLGVHPAYVHAPAGGDLDAHETVRAAIADLEGLVLFPPPDDGGPYRTVHEHWAVRYLERELSADGERAAERRFGRCVSRLLALAEEPAIREAITAELCGDAPALESIVADPTAWAEETVATVFELGRSYPKLTPLFGTTGSSSIELPATCSAATAARVAEWRGRMTERAGEYDRADSEFQRLATEAAELGGEPGDRLRLESLLGRCDASRKRGELDAAGEFAADCLALAERVDDRRYRAAATRRLGEIEWRRGRYDRAREQYEDSLELARELGDRGLEASCLRYLGIVAWEVDDYERARERYERSLAIKRELGDRSGEAKTLNNLGTVAHQRGAYERATECFRHSLAIKRELGDRHGEANTLNNLGVIAETVGEYDRAQEYHERSLELTCELGDRHGEVISRQNVAGLAAERGRYDRAVEELRRSLELATELEDRHGEAHSRITLGTVRRRQGRLPSAREQVETGLALAREVGTPTEERRALRELVALAREEGDLGRAESLLETARSVGTDTGDPLSAAKLRLERARLALAQGEPDTAREAAERAREAFVAEGAAHWIGRTDRVLGAIAVDRGDPERARRRLSDALERFEVVAAYDDALSTLETLATEVGDGECDGNEDESWTPRAESLLAEAPDGLAERHREWIAATTTG